MEVWGITGLRGSGKTTAARYLAEKGYPTIDADQIAQLVVNRNTEEGREGFEAIYRVFGNQVLDNLGNLDKRALMKKLLLNPSDKEKIESILDPLVLKHVEKAGIKWKQSGAKFAFIEGSRLAEAGFHRVTSGLIHVATDFSKRVNRVAKRDSMGKLEVEAMLQAQVGAADTDLMKRASKREWKNDGSEAAFRKTIDAFLEERLGAKK
jgi:dephospho-CoA kinase